MIHSDVSNMTGMKRTLQGNATSLNTQTETNACFALCCSWCLLRHGRGRRDDKDTEQAVLWRNLPLKPISAHLRCSTRQRKEQPREAHSQSRIRSQRHHQGAQWSNHPPMADRLKTRSHKQKIQIGHSHAALQSHLSCDTCTANTLIDVNGQTSCCCRSGRG